MYDLLNVPATTDIAYSWITKLFDSDESAPLSHAFAVFGSTLGILATMLMGWHIVIGIVHSSYTGKVLGERWHQVWAPLRVVLGFGLLIPVAGGFSSVHFLLKDVIGVAAVNLGNAPIVAYIKSASNRENGSKIYTTVGNDIAKSIIDREICYAVVNNYNGIVAKTVNVVASVTHPEGGAPNTPTFMAAITPQPSVWYYDNCGSLSFSPAQTDSSEFLKDLDASMTSFNKARDNAMTQMVASIQQKGFMDFDKIGAFFAANGDYDPNTQQGKDLIKSMQSQGILPVDLVNRTTAIADTYNKSVSTAAAELFKKASDANADALTARIERYGFMAAGSYERSLSVVSGMIVSLASDKPQTIDASFAQAYAARISKALAAYSQVRSQDALAAAKSGNPQADDEAGWSDYMLAKIFTPNLLNMKLSSSSKDPIGDMITFGHTLLGAASLGIIGLAGMSAGTGFLRGVPGIGGAASGILDYLSQWIGYIIMIFVVVGILHSFVLPMLPMMMVFVMGVSWLVLFLEASIAGLLWAFAFVRMDGQEFFDKNQAPGVTLLFNLLLRPAISMLAYCGMLLLLPTLLNSLSEIWDQSYAVQTGQLSWLFVWQWLAGLVLFTYMQWHLTLRITSLIPTIADRVGHWMGFSGMHGYNDGQETSQALGAMAAAGMAASKAPFMPGPSRRGGGGGMQQQQANKKDANSDGGQDGGGSDDSGPSPGGTDGGSTAGNNGAGTGNTDVGGISGQRAGGGSSGGASGQQGGGNEGGTTSGRPQVPAGVPRTDSYNPDDE
jgi:conjugal transfer/type IV secretion protein DotA/TraY